MGLAEEVAKVKVSCLLKEMHQYFPKSELTLLVRHGTEIGVLTSEEDSNMKKMFKQILSAKPAKKPKIKKKTKSKKK